MMTQPEPSALELQLTKSAECIEAPQHVESNDDSDGLVVPGGVPSTLPSRHAPGETNPEHGKSESTEKKKPYLNLERVKTGGISRVSFFFALAVGLIHCHGCDQDKLSEEELSERMSRIREQNERIKQRRMVRSKTSHSNLLADNPAGRTSR